MGASWIRAPGIVSGTSFPGRSLLCVCVLSHFADRGISHTFNVVVPIHTLQGEVLGVVPSLQ